MFITYIYKQQQQQNSQNPTPYKAMTEYFSEIHSWMKNFKFHNE